MDKILSQIAMQGFGYLLFVGSLLVIFFLYKENKKLNEDKVILADQRVADLKEARDSYAVLSDAATKVAENTYTIVQNLQQVLNGIKKL